MLQNLWLMSSEKAAKKGILHGIVANAPNCENWRSQEEMDSMRVLILGILMGIGIGCLLPHFGNDTVLLGVPVLLALCGFVLGRMAGTRWLAAIGGLYCGQALAWLCQREQLRTQLDYDPELALFQVAGVLVVMTLVAIPAALVGRTLQHRNQES